MTNGRSIIDLGDISKPATVLIEKISNAVGVLYEPRRIRKKAEAEAAAEKIKALASIEIREIEQRAIDRLIQQETRKQANIESITAQAIESVSPDAKVDDLEEDWVAHFFDKCDKVSDEEMQTLWARLLAGEANRPGTFSKRTVDLVASMDKKDASLFTDFCQFCWYTNDFVPLIYNVDHEIYSEAGITFSSLKHLDAIGLISFEPISGYKVRGLGKLGQFFYHGQPIIIEFPKDSANELEVGKALLTSSGKELAPICGAARNENFYEYIVGHWYSQRLTLFSMLRAS